ncbi:MAG TPA: glycosyltransferase family 2 protein [Steroidobacteraceae bacterium]|nr:glycosyltransferase family 2 protein [Steroidobacteraceae bacterium]
MKTSIVIPFYNHAGAIASVVDALKPLDLYCFIVDDGSDAQAQQVLSQIAIRESWVKILRLPHNSGKGAAVMAGCDAALAAGFTHALQIDADGQHDVADAASLLAQSRLHPAAMISGEAIYDSTVPRSRHYGRYLTHLWVWINTLSFDIRDSMCGLRVYPLAATCDIWRAHRIGRRMDFDTEIMVRLHWNGLHIIAVPARVTYPRDGVSHFKMLKDNVFISRMHTRLFFGMLWRLPALLTRRLTHRGPKAFV